MRAGLAAIMLGVLFSCAPRIENRGNDVDIDYLLEIVPGTTNKSRVSALLGAPSTKSDYGEETWIYISAKTKTVAFFKEELITRKVIYIAFDANGIVGSIGRLSEKDGTKIEYVSRETPTAGQRITLIQQLIGNIGRFNSTGAGEQ
jgi:outer membrane protein assembly factor BamE (lipoprotein component of BamABCDE complex)